MIYSSGSENPQRGYLLFGNILM